ncbi:MAG: nitroreductase family protein [Chloroflexi bacterium]|nr:nitroreductase family protein [Chloroflexota bacterium]
MNAVLDFFRTRRSIRRYESRPVAREVVEEVLTAATWAPSAHNRQPWRFVVLSETAAKNQLATAMNAQLRTDLTADGLPAEQIERDASRSYQRLTEAPTLILLCLTMAEMDTYPDGRRQQNEWVMAVQSVAMAGQNLLLAAHQLGLGGCWVCAPLFCPQVVQATLGLPVDWQAQGLISLGYPAESKVKTREGLDGRVLWL